MRSTEEIFQEIQTLYNGFLAGHGKQNRRGGGEARKHLTSIKKLVTEYRKASIEESKSK